MILKSFNDLINKSENQILMLIFIMALFLRVYGINFGLPYLYDSDETFYVLHALKFGTGDFNPHWFLYPTLYMYILFFLYSFYYLLGWILGLFHSTRDFIVLYFTDPSSFYLIGRTLTALLGSLTVIMMYPIGKRLFNQRVGILASFFLAFTFLHIRDSHIIKADVPMTFFLVLSFYFAVRIFQEGKARYYILSGLIGGLTIATKYNGGLFMIFFLTAHILNVVRSKNNIKEILINRKLLFGASATLTGFLIGVPYALLDFKTFYSFMTAQFVQSKAGWLNDSFYINIHLEVITNFLKDGMGIGLEFLALSGVVYALYRRRKADILIISFPLIYYLIIGNSSLNFSRYWNPVLPFLLLVGANVLVEIVNKVAPIRSTQNSILAVLAVILVVMPAQRAIQHSSFILQKDSRVIAKEWIENNIPAGTKIAMDIDGPPISQNKESVRVQLISKLQESVEKVEARSYKVTPSEPGKNIREYYDILLSIPVSEPSYYVIKGSPTVANKKMEYYEKNNFDYIIINENKRNNFLNNRKKYPNVVNFYELLAHKHLKIKEFKPNVLKSRGPNILIYKITRNN